MRGFRRWRQARQRGGTGPGQHRPYKDVPFEDLEALVEKLNRLQEALDRLQEAGVVVDGKGEIADAGNN